MSVTFRFNILACTNGFLMSPSVSKPDLRREVLQSGDPDEKQTARL